MYSMLLPAVPAPLLRKALLRLRSRILFTTPHPVARLLQTPLSLPSPSRWYFPVLNCPDHCPISSRGWSSFSAIKGILTVICAGT